MENQSNKACYDNPLFDEEGKTYNGGKAVNQDHKAHSRSKDYVHTLPPQPHEIKFKDSKSSRKKRLWTIAFVVVIIIIIAVIVGLLAHFFGKESSSSPELYSTPLPVISHSDEIKGSLRIIKGPFSVYSKNLEDKSSSAYKYLAQSFHYKMNSIFKESDHNRIFNRTEIVLISQGSVVVNFLIHLNRPIAVTEETLRKYKDWIWEGLEDSLIVIERSSLNVFVDAVIKTTTRPTPQETCELVKLPRCINQTDYTITAFPNLFGHVSQDHALAMMDKYETLFRNQCYGYSLDFWCNVMAPPCVNRKPLPPCKKYCQDVFSKCSYPGNTTWPFSCSNLPDSTDPAICRPNPYLSAAGKCVKIQSSTCKSEGRTQTTFPNLIGNIVEAETHTMVDLMKGIETSTNCYKHTMTFACAAFLPKCSGNPNVPNHYIPPCRSLCQGFRDRCELFMDIFNQPWPTALNCSALPDSPDPSVCVGYAEAHEPDVPDECHDNEIKCDNDTCIPYNWLCDNYHDCKDGKDEDNCAQCRPDEFNCSPASAQCISSTKVCDGRIDCYEGVDESECVQLKADESHYRLEVINSQNGEWEEICADNWSGNYSEIVCKQLGYHRVSSTLLSPGTGKPTLSLGNAALNADHKFIQTYLSKKQCSSNMVVKIICEEPVCGIRPAHTSPLLRIVNGNEARPGSWPWLVSLHGGIDEKFFCGASIINERWLLTAAHCVGGGVNNLPAWTLKAGGTRRNTYSRHRQIRKAKALFPHPGFRTVDNDIALIQLDEPLIFTDYVRPVCMPKQGNPPDVGTKCVATGWGRPSETASYYMRATQQLFLEVVDWDKCKDAIGNAEQKVPYTMTKNMFCAGGTIDHDACSGDSGGPFACLRPNTTDQWIQMGIVSWGVGCAVPNVPGVYTVLPHYINWINQVITNNTDTTI